METAKLIAAQGTPVLNDAAAALAQVDAAQQFFDCFLTDGKAGAWGTTPSTQPESMLFRIIPTDEDSAELKQGLTTIRIEHRTPDGQRLYLGDIDDYKPRFTEQALSPQEKNQAVAREEALAVASAESSNANGEAHSDTTPGPSTGVGGGMLRQVESKCRIGFVARLTGLEALVVRPIMPFEDERLQGVMNYVEVVNLYGECVFVGTRVCAYFVCSTQKSRIICGGR